MSNYGIKISKPGDDVRTVADVDLAFSSDYANPKIASQSTFSINAVATTTEYFTTVYHDLGYIPLCVAYGETSPGGGTLQLLNTNDVNAMWWMKIYTDRVSIGFWMGAYGTTGTYNGYVYFFEEQL